MGLSVCRSTAAGSLLACIV